MTPPRARRRRGHASGSEGAGERSRPGGRQSHDRGEDHGPQEEVAARARHLAVTLHPLIGKIRALLASQAHERQIAAAIVLGEIGARDAPVIDALAAARSPAASRPCSVTRWRRWRGW